MSVLTSYAAVLLDVDGVLVDTEGAVLALWARVCSEIDGRILSEDARRHVVGCSVEHTTRQLFPDASPFDVARVRELVESLEPDLPVRAVPGAVELVHDLSARNVPVALVTGASGARLGRILASLGIAPHVQASVTWGESLGKPDAAPYRLAASRLGLSARDCVVVEDAVAGVRSAVRAGATCIGLADPSSAAGRELRSAGAATVVGSIREVALALALPNLPELARTPLCGTHTALPSTTPTTRGAP